MRTKGSYSFVTVSLADLNAKFADKTQPIVIGRKWAEGCAIQGTAKPVGDITQAIQGHTPATAVAIKVTDLNG